MFGCWLAAGCHGQIALPNAKPKPDLSNVPKDPVTTKSCGDDYSPGHVMIHRLSNVEYNNTVRDLLFTLSTPADTFASSSVGSSGFTNQSDVLTLSDQIVSDYFAAAQALADEAQSTQSTSGGAWSKLTGCAAGQTNPSTTCVQQVVQAFAERAFRRPIDPDDLTSLMSVYQGETTFADGFHDVIVAVLIDPRFLFSYVEHPAPDDPTVVAPLNGYELASRLSYFIWESMPDDTLIALAQQGKLTDAATLQAQVTRMLQDNKAQSFVTTWRRDWAHLTLLDGTTAGYGGLPSSMTDDLRRETQYGIQDLVDSDRSILELVTSDHTFVNQNVASFYGWNIPEATSANFVKVAIPDTHRRGVLTQASLMLTVGGGESYTHPVQRGRWVMDSLLCSAPGAPPPGVPSLDMGTSSSLPIRDRLAQHTASPSCNGCHAVMDVYGLGLENYDMQGKWRTEYAALNDLTIDASGTLPSGQSFTTPDQMIGILGTDPRVQTCLTQKLMAYALTRPMDSTDDACVAQVVGGQYASAAAPISQLFTHVALSHQFLTQAGAAP